MKLVVCGNYGAKNLGDEMILEGLLTSLRAVVPQAEITVLSGDPKETLEFYEQKFHIRTAKKFAAGIKSFALSAIEKFKPHASDTSKIVKECDYFILGGGGLFGSLTFRANLIWAVQALMAYRLEKPVIMYGQSISPIRWKIIRWLVRKIFQKAELIAVRDENSKVELKKLGVTKKIYLIPDPAFNIPPLNAGLSNSLIPGPTIVVALRQMPGLSQHFKHYIAEFLDWLVLDHNYQIKFIDFQQGKEGDNKLHREIAAMLTNTTHVKSTAPSVNHLTVNPATDDLLHEFSHADLILGMRLHSIITAIKTKTPFMAISYAPKVANSLKTANLQKYMIGHEVLDTEKLKSMFKLIQQQHETIKKQLSEFNNKALKNCLKFEEDVLRNILF